MLFDETSGAASPTARVASEQPGDLRSTNPWVAEKLGDNYCGWLRNPAPVDNGSSMFNPLFIVYRCI